MKNDRFFKWVFPSIFAAIGAIVLTIGIVVFIKEQNFKKNAVECTAVISYMESYYDSDDDLRYNVYVQYTVDGYEYEQCLNYHTSGMYVGKEVTIYYDPLNPYDIASGSGIFILIICGIIGIVFLLVGVIMLVGSIRKSTSSKSLLTTGQRVYAEISNVYLNTSYTVNGRSPFTIECCWVHPSTGVTYFFKSENLWFDPGFILDQQGITTLPVHLDMANPQKYHVDVTALTDRVQVLS